MNPWPSSGFQYFCRFFLGEPTVVGVLEPVLNLIFAVVSSGQIIIFHQPRFPWNKGISLTKPQCGVRSCEVAIIWPGFIFPTFVGLTKIRQKHYDAGAASRLPRQQDDRNGMAVYRQVVQQYLYLGSLGGKCWWIHQPHLASGYIKYH